MTGDTPGLTGTLRPLFLSEHEQPPVATAHELAAFAAGARRSRDTAAYDFRLSGPLRETVAIARALGMTGEAPLLWLRQADLDEGERSDGPTSDEREELRRLRRESRILREERAILKTAAAVFAPEAQGTGAIR